LEPQTAGKLADAKAPVNETYPPLKLTAGPATLSPVEMSKLAISLACGPYDRTEALRNGAVQLEGVELNYIAIQSPPEIFSRMVTNQAFDVSEMSCSHYLVARSKEHFPFVAVPVFPSRVFRHGYIFVNSNAGIRTASDLDGKRIGVPEVLLL